MSGLIRAQRFLALAMVPVFVACTAADDAPRTETPQTGSHWSLTLDDEVEATFSAPGTGQNPSQAGEHLVWWTSKAGLGVALETGEVSWRAEFDDVICATAPQANADGLIVVLLDNGDAECTHAALIDTADGTIRWSVALPDLKRRSTVEVAVGDRSVVVSDYCDGVRLLSVEDGALVKRLARAKRRSECPTAATDGNTVVVETDGIYRTFDANTGRQTSRALRGPLGQVGDLVSTSPLVTTALVYVGQDGRRFQGSLIDLDSKRAAVFGRSTADMDGAPRAMAVEGTTAWLEYSSYANRIKPGGNDIELPDTPTNVVGYDLTTHNEVDAVPTVPGARLLGSHDGKIVLLTEGEIRLADPLNVDDYTVIDLPDGVPTDAGPRLFRGYLYWSYRSELAAARVPELAD